MDLNKIEDALTSMNRIVSQINPLIGVVGGLAALVIETARRAGVNTREFEDEMAQWDINRENLRTAIDEFNAKYPAEPTPPPTT